MPRIYENESSTFCKLSFLKWLFLWLQMLSVSLNKGDFCEPTLPIGWHLPTLHCTCYRIDAWAIRRPWLVFVNTLRTRYWGVFTLQGLKRFAVWVWPMVLGKLGNRWKWKGEAWFHYTKVLSVRVVGIAEMWFYLVQSEK